MQCSICKSAYSNSKDTRTFSGDTFGYKGVNLLFCINCFSKISHAFNNDLRENFFKDESQKNLSPPKEISAKLSEYVIGQEEAKKVLSVAVYNHYKRLGNNQESNVEIQKSNVLLIGSTGSGKTYLAQTLSKILEVPFSISDATSLTEAGYVGEDVENILLRLYQSADGDIEKTQRGIIYIDEIDKIARKTANPSLTKELGEGTQQSLLKILEGAVVNVPRKGGRKHPEQDFLQIDTKGILFILGGAFEGIEDIAKNRLNQKNIGFDNVKNNIEKSERNIIPETEDILKFGFIPEFVGRIASIVNLKKLNKSDLLRILQEPKNSIIKQYQALFHLDNVELLFDDKSLDHIAKSSLNEKNGARALRSLMENLLLEVMYEIPSMKNVTQCLVKYDKKTYSNKIELKNSEGQNIKSFISKEVA